MMPAQNATEKWSSGDNYERFMGRWSRQTARAFLNWLALPDGLRWLDVGCGTGALSAAIVAQCAPQSVVGIDPSADFVSFAASQVADARVRFATGDGQNIPSEDDAFDAIVSGLALNFMPDHEAALAEMLRVTVSGGTLAAYVWDYAGEMQWLRIFWDAAIALDDNARALDEGARFPICQPEALANLFEAAGLREVAVTTLDTDTRFESFDDYWTPFLSGNYPAPRYLMSLDEDGQTALREAVRQRAPVAADGSITLIARALAVRGMKS